MARCRTVTGPRAGGMMAVVRRAAGAVRCFGGGEVAAVVAGRIIRS